MIPPVQFGALMVREKSLREHGNPEHVGEYRKLRRKEAEGIRILEEAGVDLQVSAVPGVVVKGDKLEIAPENNGVAVQYIDRDTREELCVNTYRKDQSPKEVMLMALGSGISLFGLRRHEVTVTPNTYDFENGKGPQVLKIDSRGRKHFAKPKADIPPRWIDPITSDEPTFHSPSDGRAGLVINRQG